jgi:hypothetical protein
VPGITFSQATLGAIKMQFQGTGKDARFPKGQPFDIPDGDTVTIEKIIAEGAAKPVDLVGQTGPPNPARRVVEVADADLRDDPLLHEQDRALADSLSEDDEREVDAAHDEGQVAKRHANKAEKAASEHPAEEGGVESGRTARAKAQGGSSASSRRSSAKDKDDAKAKDAK